MKVFLTSWLGGFNKVNGERIPAKLVEANGLLDRIKENWPKEAKVMLIPASPDDYDKNDSVFTCQKEAYPMSGLSVSSFEMVDDRNEEVVERLREMDVIILAGGHVPTQNAYMKKLGIKEKLENFDGLVIAWSAGSMNCADMVYAGPELEGEATNPDFQRWIPGLGLTKINIFPHFDRLKDDVLDGLRVIEDITYADSMGHEIIALNDGSYIMIGDGVETLYGEAYSIKDGKQTQICENGQSVVLNRVTLNELYTLIDLQPEMIEKVEKCFAEYEFNQLLTNLDNMTNSVNAQAAYEGLTKELGEDPGQIKMLCCYLKVMLITYEKYRSKGIPEEIFTDTMKCFRRFIGECKKKTGEYNFDRSFWVYRQVSMVLFRIGELEYEFLTRNGEKVIDIHIPSDAVFTDENVDASLQQAEDFILKFYPEYADAKMMCDSWLLSTELRKLLKDTSNIYKFQNRFEIFKQDPDAMDCIEWLFQMPENTSFENLKEETSLQRSVKEVLLRGGKIGIGFGVLKQ